jgi:site-specific DNA-methyltransferase (adenine-specific)
VEPLWTPSGPNLVIEGDNAMVLPGLPDGAFQVVYLDPPFNTGRVQSRTPLRTTLSATGGRVGFRGQTFEAVRGTVTSYDDAFADYWAFLEPKLEQAWRLLAASGTLYLHLDYREVHYAKVLLDALFGRECFLNEVVWAYDYGARTKRKWPAKHDTILVYVKDPRAYHFDSAAVDREPYMAPGLVTPEKAARGKLPTDVWWHTIVSPTGREKTGYPTQKPLGVLRRIIAASSRPGDWVLDFFAGSGTTGAAASELGRRFVLVDANPEAIAVMRRRLSGTLEPVTFVAPDPDSSTASPDREPDPVTATESGRSGDVSVPTAPHLAHLRRAIEVSRDARAHGNTPFGATLVSDEGEVLLEQENIEITEGVCTGHAEATLTARASQAYDKAFLWTTTLYTTAEPCAMCAGAIYWANIGRVVYAMTEARLLELTGSNGQNPTFALPCRTVFAAGQKDIEVLGPFPEVEDEAAAVHEGYWDAPGPGGDAAVPAAQEPSRSASGDPLL